MAAPDTNETPDSTGPENQAVPAATSTDQPVPEAASDIAGQLEAAKAEGFSTFAAAAAPAAGGYTFPNAMAAPSKPRAEVPTAGRNGPRPVPDATSA